MSTRYDVSVSGRISIDNTINTMRPPSHTPFVIVHMDIVICWTLQVA